MGIPCLCTSFEDVAMYFSIQLHVWVRTPSQSMEENII